MTLSEHILFDAGLFTAALLREDPRNREAYPLVEAARQGEARGFLLNTGEGRKSVSGARVYPCPLEG